MDMFSLAAVILMGLALGSFATALSWRIPRGISILKKTRSSCPACRKDLGVADLVPLFSWLFLKGKCRHCRAPIGMRYPLIELATLFLCLVFYFVYGLTPETVLVFALAPVIVSIIDIDLNHKIIPDSLNLSIFLIGVALLLVNAIFSGDFIPFLAAKGGLSIGGTLVYGFGSLLLRQVAMMILKREPMGLGDIKFFAAAGFWLGLDANAASLFMIFSGVIGIVLAMIWKKKTGEVEVPFGPSLMIAFLVALCIIPPVFVSL
jgi:leader peptidase (prepilin peptidase)/N-methyltransferase